MWLQSWQERQEKSRRSGQGSAGSRRCGSGVRGSADAAEGALAGGWEGFRERRGWIQGGDGFRELMDTERGAEPQALCGDGRRRAAFAGASLIVRGQAEIRGAAGTPATPAGVPGGCWGQRLRCR